MLRAAWQAETAPFQFSELKFRFLEGRMDDFWKVCKLFLIFGDAFIGLRIAARWTHFPPN
jgi:hypothetical protein